LESIKRIHQATDTLEERIEELVHVENSLLSQMQLLSDIGDGIRAVLERTVSSTEARSAA
ncbi:MAG: hypothetical protein KDI64_14415, partial [Candidatus Accumulibacter sp.]|nr:hypothetical protein [Accumulibacter sp.]